MLFTSPVFSQVSGSVAGLVYSHGRSGMYTRARSTPTNPDSERQRIIKIAMKTLSPLWGQTLTAAQRAAWSLYAANVAMVNPLGQTIFLTGQNHFMRSNIPRIQAGIAVLLIAPTVFDLGTFTAPTIDEAVSAPNTFDIGFTDTDAWANAVGGFMLVYQGRTVGPGRAFFGGPYRFAGSIVGNPAPPLDPQTFNAIYRLSEDNIIWVTTRIIQVDGRMSLPIVLGPQTITVI